MKYVSLNKENPRPKKGILFVSLVGYIIGISIGSLPIFFVFGRSLYKTLVILCVVSCIQWIVVYFAGYKYGAWVNRHWIKYVRFFPGYVEMEHGDGNKEVIKFAEIEEIDVIPDRLFKSDTKLKLYYKRRISKYVGPLHIIIAYEIKNAFRKWKEGGEAV